MASFVLSTITQGSGDVNFTGTVYNRDISYVTYEDFGAVGDGKTDDFDAIIRTHEYANENGLSVFANETATYYIGGKNALIEAGLRIPEDISVIGYDGLNIGDFTLPQLTTITQSAAAMAKN